MTYTENTPDDVLMNAWAGGDMRAFEILYKRLSPKVYGYLKRRLQNSQDVDEVYQKIFTKLHSNRESYDSRYPVLQWVFVMARSAVLDFAKSSIRKAKLFDEIKNSEALSQNSNHPPLSEQMDTNLLKDLSPEAQTVVKLRVIDELEFQEIATLLGKGETGVRQILSRSLKKLRLNIGAQE